MNRLYFVVRTDIGIGRAMAQAIHAMDEWAAVHGPQKGTVIVYEVAGEEELLSMLPQEGRTLLWREPDLGNQATAFATDRGRMDLPLLGRGVRPFLGTPPTASHTLRGGAGSPPCKRPTPSSHHPA